MKWSVGCKRLCLLLKRSGFMIIRVMVLLRRIREKMVGGSEGSKKNNSQVPKVSTAKKVALDGQ